MATRAQALPYGTKPRGAFSRGMASAAACFFFLTAGGAAAQQADDWCHRVAPGPRGASSGALALSAAHAQVRFFGTGPHYAEGDLALARALEGTTVDWDAAALAYAAELESVCALDVTPQRLPVARVVSLGPVALVRPGTGELTLPRATRVVVIDLRGLPAAPGLEQALANAIGVASATPVPRVSQRVRVHTGMTDELNPYNVYSNDAELREQPPYAPTGRTELPVALLTGPTLAPAAARFAVDLRLAQRAWLLGAPVSTAVAESRWMPIGSRGLVVRTAQLEDAQGVLPDLLPADLEEGKLQGLTSLGRPPPVDRGTPAQRPVLKPRDPSQDPPPLPAGASNGIARADLLIVHGATRLFFSYFPVVGDGIDGRLLETLASVDASPVTDRVRQQQLLLRFNEVLRDGHGFVNLLGPQAPSAGVFPVYLEQVALEPVVRRSAAPGVLPGDTLISIAGRPMSEWLAEESARASAATPEYLHNVAARRLIPLTGPTVFGLRGVDGSVRSVEVQPQPAAVRDQLGLAPSLRPAGWLADLGAPSLYYINLSDRVLTSLEAFNQALAEANDARGLVLDMRGYPGISHYEVAQRLIPTNFLSPIFRVPRWAGPDAFDVYESVYPFEPLSEPSYAGPIVLLTGPGAVSAAENFSMMLTGAHRVTVVGRRSAGTNGNVTRLVLPGLMQVMFTGMEVLFPDGSRFHGVGIVPDIEVAPTAADLAENRDPELLRAIQFLSTGR
ncbi:peptidase S41 [Archangium minus]|uniref:Peptidase S41 n=1 Tax=Archangium minus TaxID=83450 RepID=A0ABY9WSJ4_9BACT|nr:peptidase S41 [Archangium minus]